MKPNDCIKTTSDRFEGKPWRGKIRRIDYEMALIEWRYAGDNPTDICTWVYLSEIKVTRKAKVSHD